MFAALVVFAPMAQSKAPSPYAWASRLPGCHTSHPAVAHYGNRKLLRPQPKNGPVPCGVLTGWPSVETRLVVTNRGTVIYEPALHGGTDPSVAGGCGSSPGVCSGNFVARSTDNGAHWADAQATSPFPESKALQADVDNNMYVDPRTGRIFYYDYSSGTEGAPGSCGNGAGAVVYYSDDDGKTWGHGLDFEHNCSENPTILVARPTISKPSYDGGVVYLCGNNFGSGAAGAGSTGKICAKSLDGGKTWLAKPNPGGQTGHQTEYVGQLKDRNDPYDGQLGCDGAASSGSNDVQPMPDGTLLTVITCGDKAFLSKSVDEGASWTIKAQLPTPGVMRADSEGNLYKLNGTLLSTSTSVGRTWSKEHDMLAPGIDSYRSVFFAQGTHAAFHRSGDVAIMYYGVRHGQTASDGFIAETRNALARNPVFWTGQVNDRNRPLVYNTLTEWGVGQSSLNGLTVLDFIGGAFSPDGRSVWASFVQSCGADVRTDPNCIKRFPTINPNTPQDGFAGRLVWPAQQG
jgi:hypothetical protein